MTQNNQGGNYEAADSIQHFGLPKENVDSANGFTIMTAENEETEEIVGTVEEINQDNQGAIPHTGGSNAPGWIGMGISICVAAGGYLLIRDFKKKLNILKKRVVSYETEVKSLTCEIADLKVSINAVKSLSQSSMNIRATEHTNVSKRQNDRREIGIRTRIEEPAKVSKRSMERYYATLQAPGGNGELRFSERSMSRESSSERMFIVEVDVQRGTGIYRLNPAAKSLILNDFQLFREFVKPFTFGGNPSQASITDKAEGKIRKNGKYWIVEEPLEIFIS